MSTALRRGGANTNNDNRRRRSTTLGVIEQSLLTLHTCNHNKQELLAAQRGEGRAPMPSPAEQQEAIDLEQGTLAALLSSLQDLCTALCIGGEAHLRSLDVSHHVQVLMQCFRTEGVGLESRVLSLRAMGLIAEGTPKGVTAIVNCGGIQVLLGIIHGNIEDLVSSDQYSEEVIKCIQALATDAHRRLIKAGAVELLLELANTLSDYIVKNMVYTCLADLFSVATPEDWADLEPSLGTLLVVLDERIRGLRSLLVERNKSRRPETRQQAAHLRNALATLRRDEEIVVKLASCFIHLIDRVCVTEELCASVFGSDCGERFVPLVLTLLTFSENTDATSQGGAIGGNSSSSIRGQTASSDRLQSAAISLLSCMFVASPRQTLARLSRHGAWRWLKTLTVALVTSTSEGNTMRTMVYGKVNAEQLEALADLNQPPPTDGLVAIPSPTAAAAAGSGTAASNAALAAANKSLLASIRPPKEPLVSEEYRAITLLELLLFLTPPAASVIGGGSTEQSIDCRSLITPIHMWQWEDDYHNRYDYEEHVSTALEMEYRTQQVTRVYRSVDITAANRSVSASFERMRHYTLGGVPLRPLFRQPFVSHFYHTRLPLFVPCTCYHASVREAEGSPSRIAVRPMDGAPHRGSTRRTSVTRSRRDETPPRRAPSERLRRKKKSKGFFAKLCGCCTRADRDVSPERSDARLRRDPNLTSETPRDGQESTGGPMDMGPRDEQFFDTECRAFLDANAAEAASIGASLVGVASTVARRVVNPALLRHCSMLLLRGLTLMRDARLSMMANPCSPAEGGEPGSPSLMVQDCLATHRGAIIRTVYILMLCSDMEHLERLCTVTTGANENDDHTHAPRWQMASGGFGEKPLGGGCSLQGEMLLGAVECIHLLVELDCGIAEEFVKEGVYRLICGGSKSLATLCEENSCPQHHPTQYLMAEAHRRLISCGRLIEQTSGPLRHSSSSALLSPGMRMATFSSASPRDGEGDGPAAHHSYASVDDALASPIGGVDRHCPQTIHRALLLWQSLKRNGPLSLADQLEGCVSTADESRFCQLCSVTNDLRRGDMTSMLEVQETQSASSGSLRMVGSASFGRRVLTNRSGQTLAELLASPAGAHYKEALEDLTVRLVTFVGDQVGVAGSSVSDVVGITRNHKVVTQPMSRVMACMNQRLSLPISFKLVPLHPLERSEDGLECSVTVKGRVVECVPSHGGIVSINLQAFLYTTIGAVADDLAAKYTEVILSLGWNCRCVSMPYGMLCDHCRRRDQPEPQSRVPDSPRSPPPVARRLTLDANGAAAAAAVMHAADSLRDPLPNQIADDDMAEEDGASGAFLGANQNMETTEGTPRIDPLPVPGEDDGEALAAESMQGGAVPMTGDRVVLLVNGYPLVDRSRRLGDVIVSMGTSAAAFRGMLDPSGQDVEARNALVKALSVWGAQHTLQFAFIKDERLPEEVAPAITAAGCTCRSYSAKAAGAADGAAGVVPSMRQGVAYLADSICSPWHVYADQRARHGHTLVDDVLGLIECLVQVVVTPLSPNLLVDVCRRMYSSVIHSIRYQSLSFAAPAFTSLCHPVLASHQVGDSIAEYALWNYPSLFPLALRIAVFRQIIAAKRSILPKSNLAARNIVGGEWLRHLRGGADTTGRGPRNKVKATVSRDSILEEGRRVFEALALCPLTLDIEFRNEPGSGLGPTCEFFCLVAQEFLKTSYGMWLTQDGDAEGGGSSFVKGRLFPAYRATTEALDMFRLLGRVVGRALQDGREIRVPFHEAFVARILGHPIPNTAVELGELLATIDPQLEHSLVALEDMSGDDLAVLELPFTFPGDDSLALIPEGHSTFVTFDTVGEYCLAVRRYACATSAEAPARVMLEGISDSIAPGHLRLFTCAELNLLIGGPDGKLWETAEDLLRSVQCDHGYTLQSPAVSYFVSTVVSLSADEQRLFLKFLSGTDCLPIGGLSPPMTIVRKGLTAESTPYRKRRRAAGGAATVSVGGISPNLTAADHSDRSPHQFTLLAPPLQPLSNRSPRDAYLSVGPSEGAGATSEGSFSAAVEQTAANGPLQIPDEPPVMSPGHFSIVEGTSPSVAGGSPAVMEVEEIVLTTQEQVDECLPTVNTCFHYLKLPEYSSEAACRERLLCAISEGQGVFLLS